MEFRPRAPREGINVSATHPLREAATLTAGLVALLVGVLVVITWSVDLAVTFISPEAEARAFASLGLDPLVQEAATAAGGRRDDVQAVLDKLLRHWEQNAYDFQVMVIDDDEPNAAALPGGYILLTSALVDGVESENELAFVLGHELGHFHNRDHLRRLGRGVVYSLALATLVGSTGSAPDLAGRVGDLTSRSFDRGQERAADRFGLSLVAAEYGHIGSSWSFFQRLAAESSKLHEMAAYVATHPANAARIDALRRYAEKQRWPLDGPTTPF